ncbi:MAG: hypothetical protein ABF811_01990 [Pseudoclavibacter sp.]
MRLTVVEWVRGVPGAEHVGAFPPDSVRATGAGGGIRRRSARGRRRRHRRGHDREHRLRPRGEVVWPAGPALPGITWQLLDRALPTAGIPSRAEPANLRDLADFDGAALVSSIGIVPVVAISGRDLFAL